MTMAEKIEARNDARRIVRILNMVEKSGWPARLAAIVIDRDIQNRKKNS